MNGVKHGTKKEHKHAQVRSECHIERTALPPNGVGNGRNGRPATRRHRCALTYPMHASHYAASGARPEWQLAKGNQTSMFDVTATGL